MRPTFNKLKISVYIYVLSIVLQNFLYVDVDITHKDIRHVYVYIRL